MIESVTEEMHGSNWVSDRKRLQASLWLVWQNLQRERNGALRSARVSTPKKYLTGTTLSERRF